ncbi:hypothetical protein FRC03_003839 [Tulasnella sp. 419]|nr:hypothetical protein FRC03_003839 [Tulasnella sp. 419]
MSKQPTRTSPNSHHEGERTVSSSSSSTSSSSRRFNYHSRPLIPILVPSSDAPVGPSTPTTSGPTHGSPSSGPDWFIRRGQRVVMVKKPLSSTFVTEIRVVVAEIDIDTPLMIKEVVVAHVGGAKYNIPYAVPHPTHAGWFKTLRDYNPRVAAELQVPERPFKFIDSWSAARESFSDMSGPAKELLKLYLTGLLNIQIENLDDWDILEWGIIPQEERLEGQSSPTSRRNWQDVVGGFEYKR